MEPIKDLFVTAQGEAWFLHRMKNDEWQFALELNSGKTVLIKTITNDWGDFIDVKLQDREYCLSYADTHDNLFIPVNTRLEASIRKSEIAFAYDTQKT